MSLDYVQSPDTALYRVSHVRSPAARWLRIVAVLAALLVNASTTNLLVLAGVGLIGWSMIGVHRLRGVRGGFSPTHAVLLAGVALLASRALVGFFHADAIQDWQSLGLKFLSGAAWLYLLSSVVSWSDLKDAVKWPPLIELAHFADSSVGHGFILLSELERRRQMAYLRLFREGKRNLGLQELSWALAGGIDQALDRMTHVEEARTLRVLHPMAVMTTTKQTAESESSLRSAGPLLEFIGVGVASNGVHRLQDCSFNLKSGEWIALAGPSGAGKTTLLRAASGLTPISSGKLIRLGQSLKGKEALHHRVHSKIGLVCQDPHEQILGSTPLADIALGLRARRVGASESERRALEMMESLGILHLADRPIHRLSFGERKRVAFASVLVCDPELLLCDEPTGGLDPVAADSLIRVLEKISAKRTMSVLWATHDWGRLPRSIERVLLLSQGKLFFDGPSVEGLSRSRLVAAGLETNQDI